jgi:hypothetical protein
MKSQGFDRVRFNRYQEKLIFSSASMKYLPLLHETAPNPTQKQMITVPLAKTQQDAKIYEWRSKTEFPVAKITRFSLVESNTLNSVFEVEVEKFSATLAELKNISLFKMLYLLKEAVIGFERLFHSYGPFAVSARMIGLNMTNKCKVWLNDNFASNACRFCQLDEKAFLAVLFRVFE